MALFKDRIEAGEALADSLFQYKNKQNVIVLALPRGGVPIGYEVAKALNVPLDIFLVRKLGVPGFEELALGAIASGGITVFNEDILKDVSVSKSVIEQLKEEETRVLKKRETLYRGNRTFPDIKDKTVILVDDGVATGATMRVAIKALKALHPQKIMVAIPLAPFETCELLRREADEVVCLETPYPFYAIGSWYEYFPQTSDEEVQQLLETAHDFGK